MNRSLTAAHPMPVNALPTRARGAIRPLRASAQGQQVSGGVPLEAVLPSRPDGGSHATGLVAVIVVHLLVGYALVSGLAQKVVNIVREPLEARLIEAVKPPPPPPPPAQEIKPVVKVKAPPPPFVPPPEVRVEAPPPAPTIAAVTHEPPPAPVEFKPDPPPAPPPPAPVPAAPDVVAIGVACPTMVNPVAPRRAQQEGIAGMVKARATIRDGKVVNVQILASTPRGLFDAAVRDAMAQYGCKTSGAGEVVAVQTFEFRSQ